MRVTHCLVALSLLSGACDPRKDVGAAPEQTAAEDPNAKKTVAKEDCAKWAEHGVTVIVADMKDAVKECPEEQRFQLVGKLDGQRDAMRLAAVETCVKHVGEGYLAKDGKCWLDAKDAAALGACKFTPMIRPGDDDLGKVAATYRKVCKAK